MAPIYEIPVRRIDRVFESPAVELAQAWELRPGPVRVFSAEPANAGIYVLPGDGNSIHAYGRDGSRQLGRDIGLGQSNPASGIWRGLAGSDDRLWFSASRTLQGIRAIGYDGTRYGGEDLGDRGVFPVGMEYTPEGLISVLIEPGSVVTYNVSGERQGNRIFNVSRSGSRNWTGIAVSGTRVYCLDNVGTRVWAYALTGTRHTAEDVLLAANTGWTDLTWFDGRLYVLAAIEDVRAAVHVYSLSGTLERTIPLQAGSGTPDYHSLVVR